MSQTLDQLYSRQYSENLQRLYDQGPSILRGTVMERTVTGEVDFWDRVGSVAAVPKTVRHSDTPIIETPFSRRMCTLTDNEVADLVDKQDRIRMLADPNSPVAVSQAEALNRAYDAAVITAFTASASTGKQGDTALTFDLDWLPTSGRAAAASGDTDVSAAAIDIDDILDFKKVFDKQKVPPKGRHILLTEGGIRQLLTTTEVGSADYNTVRALVQGDIDTFCGFKFHMLSSDYMPLAGSADYYCFAWHERAVGVSVGMELMTRVEERADKSYATQIYAARSFGAVRIQGPGVQRFRIDNAA